jgi:hypothetical protein
VTDTAADPEANARPLTGGNGQTPAPSGALLEGTGRLLRLYDEPSQGCSYVRWVGNGENYEDWVQKADGEVVSVDRDFLFDEHDWSLDHGYGLCVDAGRLVRRAWAEMQSSRLVHLEPGHRVRHRCPGFPDWVGTVVKVSKPGSSSKALVRPDDDDRVREVDKRDLFELDGSKLVADEPKEPKEEDRPHGKGRGEGQAATDRPAEGAGADGRPEVEITAARHQVHKQTIKTLAADPALYRRGDVLGVVIEEQEDEAKFPLGVVFHATRGTTRFLPLTHAAVGCMLTRNADFYKMKKGRRGEPYSVPADPPDWLIAAVRDQPNWPGVRELLTIAESPAVKADGTLTPTGYDPETGCIFRPSIPIDPLPDRPTQDDAKQAKDRLYSVVRQFPFLDDFARAVWLASLLTAIQRPVISGPVPGFVLNANKAGTGKGLLINIVGIIAWGHVIATRTYPRDKDESGKVKLSIALGAVKCVHFDNITEGGYYGNSNLDSALTSTVVDDRILGVSKDSGPVPCRPCWFASGNNLSPFKDAYRRWIPCYLVTNEEMPHLRADIEVADLCDHVLKRRGELLRDTLIILKAHALAGRPTEGKARLGSYEDWDPIVRGAVWFATGLDCLEPQHKADRESPQRVAERALMSGWMELDPNGNGKTIEDAIEMARQAPFQ